MKKNKVLLLLTSILMFSSCASTGSSGYSTSSSIESSEKESIYEISLPEEEQISKCTTSGIFLDIAIGRWLCIGKTYKGDIKSNLTDQTLTFTNSNPENVVVELNEKTNMFTFKPIKAGDSLLRIFDNDGVLIYKNVIKARDGKTSEEMNEFLLEVDHFKAYGFNGQASITFLTETEGIFYGYDGSIFLDSIPFTYEYTGVSDISNDEYEYTIIEWENTRSDMIFSKFYIDFTGYMMHAMTKNITIDLFFPQM